MKPKVLIVDDEFGIRKMFSEMLALESCPADEAVNGGPALDLMRTSPQPLAVLLVLAMPIVNGEQMLAEVADDPDLAARYRIIMVTGSTD